MSVEEKQRIARQLLLSSAPGQFDLVLSDLKGILLDDETDDVLTLTFCQEVRSEYDKQTGRSLLFLEPTSGDDVVDDDDELTKILQTNLDQYISTHYSSAKGVQAKAQVLSSPAEDNGAQYYTLSVYAERVNLKNFNAGSWNAVYQLMVTTTSSGAQEAQIQGEVQILTHTFENNGNLQLSSTIPLTSTSVAAEKSSPTELVKSIVRKIETFDKEHILQPIQDIYNTIGSNNGTLKKLRRVMPVTRTKFNWNVASHRFVKNLSTNFQHNNN